MSCLIFKSVSHFKIIFMYDVRKCSNFKDLHVSVPISQHYLLKRLSSLYILLEDCRRLIDLRSINGFMVNYGFISEFSILFHMSVFMPISCHFGY